MNENGRNHFTVEGVGLLCAADNSPYRHILMVIEQVTHQRRFTRTATTDENHHGVLGNFAHIEAFNVEIDRCSGHLSVKSASIFWREDARVAQLLPIL